MVILSHPQVANIFSVVYGYQCIIDTIAQSQNDLGENIDGETTVVMHFIDDTQNAPVSVNDILAWVDLSLKFVNSGLKKKNRPM